MAEASLEDAARCALCAFAYWGKPNDEDLSGWVAERLWDADKLSSTERAVLYLAASLLGIGEHQVRVYGRGGEELVGRRHVPPLGEILSASFDPHRQAHVLLALELALIGHRLRLGERMVLLGELDGTLARSSSQK